MADRKVSATPKKRRERPYIKFYVTAEQKAQMSVVKTFGTTRGVGLRSAGLVWV